MPHCVNQIFTHVSAVDFIILTRGQFICLAMNEAEFSLYIAKEEEKYQQMKEKAAQRAIERAKNLGV